MSTRNVNKQPQGSVYQYDEVNQRLRSRQKFFKPFSLRTPVLSALLAASIILIALVEVACRRLPSSRNRGVVATLNSDTSPIVGRYFPLLGRQDGAENTLPPIVEVTTVQTISGVEETIVVISSLITPPAPPPPEVITTCFESESISTCETITSAFTTSAVPATNYLLIGTRTIGRKSSPTPTPIPIAVPTPNAPETAPVLQPTPGVVPGIQPSLSVGGPPVEPTTSIVPATLDSIGNYVPPITVVVTPLAPVSPPHTTIPASFSSGNNPTRVSTPAKAGTTVVISGSTIVLLPTDASVSGNTEDVVYYFSKRDYIVGAFLPTIIAVLFSIPWGIVDTAAKEMEPFVRLASDEGASARFSLCLDYPGDFLLASPFKSLFRGHWIILLTSTMNLASLLLAPLASETVFISLQGTCNAETNGQFCVPTLSVYPPAARVLQAVLALLAIFLLFVTIFARRRSTGVYANPHSLAAVATLFHHPRLIDIFRNVPPATREKALETFLQAHSYKMGHYEQNQRTAYGMLVDPKDQGEPEGYTYINLNGGLSVSTSSAGNQARKMKRAAQVLFFTCALAALTAIVLWYRFSTSENIIFTFMQSQSVGVRFLFTTFGVLIRLFWDYARAAIHKHEPYYNLRKGASASSTVLLTPSPNPLPGMFRALRRLAIFQFVIDLSTVLCDPLTVSLANVPFNSGMTYQTFVICVWICVFILGFMLLTLLVVLVRIGRFGGEVKVPATLGGKMKLLAGSHMIERFRELGDMDTETRDNLVRGWGSKYQIGTFTGVDGIRREGVDFEEYVNN
ncbi:hypothetical protein BKA65DRAFT_561585 [Rhexocercosporidium sp. MPI-PUGE-AT-0058]|nr:hypothetical protein BKA65DRAFT_561585 [Rhexocercosporidium sp. MPI-PUGE-AT-0058]